MKIEVREHKVPKKTLWGTVEKSLNQYVVLIENEETKQFVQCGYVGETTFLPLSGFPQELCEEVASECSKLIGKHVAAGTAPPSLAELAKMLAPSEPVEQEDGE
jgi:hypothetical protein